MVDSRAFVMDKKVCHLRWEGAGGADWEEDWAKLRMREVHIVERVRGAQEAK